MMRWFFNGDGHVPLRVLIAALAACLLAAGAQALMVPQDQADLAAGADGILLGTVTSVESCWTAGREIETTTRIALDSAVKGAFPGRTVTVTSGGGAKDGVMQVVEDEPVFTPGDRGFYLLDRYRNGFRVHGARAGVIPVVDDAVWAIDGKNRPQAIPAGAYGTRLAALASGLEPAPLENASAATAGGPVIASVSPSSASAGTGTTITITGSGFGTKASRQSSADVGFIYRCSSSTTYVPVYATGKPNYDSNANEIVSWTDTRIVVRAPVGRMSDGYDGSASSGLVWVVTDAGATSTASPFAVTFGYGGIRWASAPTFVVNNNCPGAASASTAVANAAATWNAAIPGSSYRFVNGGSTTSTTIGGDGVNRICWRPSSEFSSGTLAVTTWWYTIATSTVTECDVKFNSGYTWTTGTASGSAHNVEAVMLHEFGHWLNLRDLYGYYSGAPSDTGKVMFGYSNDAFGNLNRKTLQADDVLGIRFIYGGGTAASPDLTTGTFATPSGSVGRTFGISSAARNGGTGSAGPFRVDFCVSTDRTFTASDTVIGSRSYTGLGAGVQGPTLETSVAIPATVPGGTYFLGMIIDPANAAVESNEDNNIYFGPDAIVLSDVVTVPGGAGVPRDLDRNRVYEDINGNGRLDFADVVLYFNQMSWIAANEPLYEFDYNANARIDFADVVWLFDRL